MLKAAPGTTTLRTTLDTGLQRHVEDAGAGRFEGEDVLIVVAERLSNGRLVLRAMSETRPGLFRGPARGTPHRSVGSLSKALLLPLLVEAGVSAPCPRRMEGMQDPDGARGVGACGPNAGIPLETVLARSLNLAYAEALSAVRPQRILAYARAIGMAVPTDAPLRHGATLGYAVPIAPDDAVRAMAMLLSGAPTSTPTVSTDLSDEWLDPASLSLFPSILDRGATLLRAPIEYPRGTLHAAAPDLPECTLHGKTGTTDSLVGDAVRDRLAFLAARCDDRMILALALVGSPRMERPLRGVSAHDVNMLAAGALRAAVVSPSATE